METIRNTLVGRKNGELTNLMKQLPTVSVEERPQAGAAINRVKELVTTKLKVRFDALLKAPEKNIDLTMPARKEWQGGRHPVTVVIDEIDDIFRELGFTIALGPEAETEWYNFGALNFPADHPAMDMHDTLYLSQGPGEKVLLRTHTSPVQIRVMQAGPPPYRVVIPGMCYRNDTADASHTPAFLQIEGLAVDEGIGFVDLKATLTNFARRFFSPTTKVRFRPSYFPFTEPSAELDVECQLCHGGGCPVCKQTGWMELLGCGMVHPAVLTNCGVDAEKYTGWAFGLGPGRTALQRYDIPDLRLLSNADMRVLRQLAGQNSE